VLKELSRLNLYNFGTGLPALAGVLLGIRLYTGGRVWNWRAALVLAIAWVVMLLGRRLVRRRPRLGAWVIESWIVSAVLVTAFVTELLLVLALNDWLPAILGQASGKALEKLSATLVGAVGTFTALVWTKDIADAKGYFWPSTQLRHALRSLYATLKVKPVGNGTEYSAFFLDAVPDTDITGWSFPDRRARAGIVSRFLARSGPARP
jgi:hypothetical protein